jgi:hypothetical protein
MENALGLLKEICEQHGAKCYLDAYDTISTALVEALKPSHNKQSDAITYCSNEDCELCDRVYVCVRKDGDCEAQR